MPIYAYRCANCGHAKDVLQRISDPVLTVCPACGEPTFQKQLTAAGFQLKGSGWYVTDFRGDGKPPKTDGSAKGDAPAPAANGDGAPASGKSAESTGADGAKSPTAGAPAAAPAPAAAAPTAAPSGGSGSPPKS